MTVLFRAYANPNRGCHPLYLGSQILDRTFDIGHVRGVGLEAVGRGTYGIGIKMQASSIPYISAAVESACPVGQLEFHAENSLWR
jgi:hypothetical protein